VRVVTACESGQRGRVRITIDRRQARRLGMRNLRTLAGKRVRCGSGDRAAVRLKPSRRVTRLLRKARGSITVRVEVRMGSGRDSRRLVLRR
jgi:hypothetical protein